MSDKFLMNRLGNCKNSYQGNFKRVLAICSAGLLRSPTTALVLSQEPYNFNTRAVGLEEAFALISIDEVLLEWADEIVCMTNTQKKELVKKAKKHCKVICLDIDDSYAYRDPKLIELIKNNYNAEVLKYEETNNQNNKRRTKSKTKTYTKGNKVT